MASDVSVTTKNVGICLEILSYSTKMSLFCLISLTSGGGKVQERQVRGAGDSDSTHD